MWNAVLNTTFPAGDGFTVKPQSRIRPEPDSESARLLMEAAPRLSSDSYEAPSQARGSGREVGMGIPDFIVASTNGTRDVPVLIVEVKPRVLSRGSMDTAVAQLRDYMGAISRHLGLVAMSGLLAAGPEATLYEFRQSDGRMAITAGPGWMTSATVYRGMLDLGRGAGAAPAPLGLPLGLPQGTVGTWPEPAPDRGSPFYSPRPARDPPPPGPSRWRSGPYWS